MVLVAGGFHARPALVLPPRPLPLRRLLRCSILLSALPILTRLLRPHPFGGGLALGAADILILILILLLLLDLLPVLPAPPAAGLAPGPQERVELLLGGEEPAGTRHRLSGGDRDTGVAGRAPTGGLWRDRAPTRRDTEGPGTEWGGYGGGGHVRGFTEGLSRYRVGVVAGTGTYRGDRGAGHVPGLWMDPAGLVSPGPHSPGTHRRHPRRRHAAARGDDERGGAGRCHVTGRV